MSDSSAVKHCPQCSAELPPGSLEGLCPRCLMAQIIEPTQAGEAATPQPSLTPAELAPHFPHLEIMECLGRGGMGVVYKARQKSLNRLVALKLLAPERADDPQFAARFEKEAQALAALNHPNIVGVYDFGQAGGFFFLLMEFVDGVNLRQLLQTKHLTPQEALSIIPPVCEALQCAHDRGIVHRDIKPENLLIDKAGAVKIADFGIAKIIHSGPPDSRDSHGAPSDAATMGFGTPDYAAPEQHDAGEMTDHRADIYSLGVVLYEMLTGERPKDKFVAPSRKVQIDVRIDEIVLRALERTPELRYQTAVEFRTQVEVFGTTAPAVPAASRGAAGMDAWRWPLIAVGCLVVGGACMMFGPTGSLSGGRPWNDWLIGFGAVISIGSGGIAFWCVWKEPKGMPLSLMARAIFAWMIAYCAFTPLNVLSALAMNNALLSKESMQQMAYFAAGMSNVGNLLHVVLVIGIFLWSQQRAARQPTRTLVRWILGCVLLMILVRCLPLGIALFLQRSVADAAEKRKTEAAAVAFSFGPTMERTLVPNTTMDFDTGTPGNFLPQSVNKRFSWEIDPGMDAVHFPSGDSGQVVVLGLKTELLDGDAWEKLPAAKVSQRMEGTPGHLFQTLYAGGKHPATYAFHTREGGTGVLQFLGSSESGVKLRFKLVQNSSATGRALKPIPPGAAMIFDSLKALPESLALREGDPDPLKAVMEERRSRRRELAMLLRGTQAQVLMERGDALDRQLSSIVTLPSSNWRDDINKECAVLEQKIATLVHQAAGRPFKPVPAQARGVMDSIKALVESAAKTKGLPEAVVAVNAERLAQMKELASLLQGTEAEALLVHGYELDRKMSNSLTPPDPGLSEAANQECKVLDEKIWALVHMSAAKGA